MHDTNKTPIEEKFLDRNDLFGIEFDGGIVFLEVDGYEDWTYKPHTNVGSVSSGSDSGFTRLEDPANGNDILFVETGETKVLHVAIGQLNPDIRRYTNYPEGENRLRTPPNLGVPRGSSGDDYGFVDGTDTPYEQPTDAEELMIVPGKHLDFDFFNTGANARTPTLNIKAREYNINFVKDKNKMKRIMNPGSPMPIYPAGSIDNQIRFNQSIDWDTAPVGRDRFR